MMEDNIGDQHVPGKPKKKRNQPKKEGKKKAPESRKPVAMPSIVQHHPGPERHQPSHQDRSTFEQDKLIPDGQGTSQTRPHNLPPKKSLSPSFIASHAASVAQESAHRQTELMHPVQHLPTSQGQGQSSAEKMQNVPDLRFIEQIMPQLGPAYQQFIHQGLDQGGLLRQQLLQGPRPALDLSQAYHRSDQPRSSPSQHRPGIDPPRSSASQPSPPPNRTVHNIPGASPPGTERGRPPFGSHLSFPVYSQPSVERGRAVHALPSSSLPNLEQGRPTYNLPLGSPHGRTKENVSEIERSSPYHVSTIRKTPSPAARQRVSPSPRQLSPHYRQDRVSPASGERPPQLSSHYKHDRVSPATGDRPQTNFEEALKLMQAPPTKQIEEVLKLMQGHPGASVPQQLLTQSLQQPVRTDPEEHNKAKEPPHKPERSQKQFISTMLANQAKARHPPPTTSSHGLSIDTQIEHAGMLPQTQFVRVSPSGIPRQIIPSGDIPRQVSPVGLQRHVSQASGISRQPVSIGGQIYHPGFAAISSSALPTSVQQTAQISTALLQPQATAVETIKRIPSPKPQHRHKDFAQAQIKGSVPNIHIPENVGPIKQPVIELSKLPIPKSTDGKLSTFSASQISSMQYASNMAQIAQTTISVPVSSHTTLSQVTQSHNVTMASRPSQGMINPFTFPSKPPMIPHPKNQPRYEVISPVVHPVEQKRKLSDIEMPQLDPVPPLLKEKSPVKVKMVKMKSPFNMRLQNLANLPTNSMYRSTYRAHSMAVHRAKAGLITSTAKTLDLLRQNLQKFINKEIDVIVKQYLDKFFKPGIENIKGNNGENSVTDEHVQAVCRQILEEAKKMYTTEQRSTTPVRDENTPVPFAGRKRNASDTDSDKSASFVSRKKKGRPPIYTSGRSTPSKPAKANEPVKREGPKWDSNRLIPTTQYIMGARANKALGLGATRGRIYIKHPDVFKYCGDQDDKQWLYENHKMPATGGKAYMMLLEDVKDLAEDDEYRNSANVMMDEIIGFCIPDWMTEKVKVQMEGLRTDKVKQRSRSTTPNNGQQGTQQDVGDGLKDLPFSNFTNAKDSPLKDEIQTSPSGDTEMEFLTGGDNDDQNNLSPFNLTGAFEEGVSPSASDLDNLEEEAPLSAPFEFSKSI